MQRDLGPVRGGRFRWRARAPRWRWRRRRSRRRWPLAQESGLGDFETHGDVGAPKLAGSATWNAVRPGVRAHGRRA